jgi:hypothetical protein
MRRPLQWILLILAVALVWPTGAGADATTTTTPTPGTTSTPAPPTTTAPAQAPPAPARATTKLDLQGGFAVAREVVTVPKRKVQIVGTVRPFIASQSVMVRAFLGHHLIGHQQVQVKPAGGGSYGRFTANVESPRVGRVVVVATHSATTQLGAFKASSSFTAVDEHVGSGSRGRFVQLVQERLAALHFFLPRSGVYDNGTELAVDSYHRLLGWGTYKTLDGRTISYLLNGWGNFRVRYPNHGRHAEGDLGKQLLALIDGSKVQLIFPISSGKPSTPTILGDFRVYRRVPGYLPDGMYYSSFFIGGYAIHGYNPAPDYPASHGCMRLPIPDAITAYNWLTFGDWVDVYQ